MKLLKWLFGSRKPTLNKPVVSGSVIEPDNDVKLMQENTTKLKAVIDEWLRVLEDGNRKHAEFEETRKHCR